MNSEKLTEWRVFAKEHFNRPRPNSRSGRKRVEGGEIPGRIIGDKVFVYVDRWKLIKQSGATSYEIHKAALDLLK